MKTVLIPTLLSSLATALPIISIHAVAIARSIVARAPPEANATLRSVTSSGTGCASNSAAFLIKDDATLAFDSLTVDSSSVAQASKKCLITLDLQLDPKWKYTINTATDVRGYTDGASASFKAVYTVGGKSSESRGDIKPSVAKDGNYFLHLGQPGATSAYGGSNATIDISLAYVREAGKEGVVTVDSIDIGFAYSK